MAGTGKAGLQQLFSQSTNVDCPRGCKCENIVQNEPAAGRLVDCTWGKLPTWTARSVDCPHSKKLDLQVAGTGKAGLQRLFSQFDVNLSNLSH